jgi:CHASE3 domain sensor protein
MILDDDEIETLYRNEQLLHRLQQYDRAAAKRRTLNRYFTVIGVILVVLLIGALMLAVDYLFSSE